MLADVQMQACEDVVLCQRTLPGVACQAALFCVFDGHNGRAAADEAAQLLPKNLTQHLQVCQEPALSWLVGCACPWAGAHSRGTLLWQRWCCPVLCLCSL